MRGTSARASSTGSNASISPSEREDTDWQIWIEIGQHPIPRKYVITSKTVTGAPQYTLRIKEWKTDAQIAANAFAFSPPAGAKKLDFKELAQIDEVPAGTTIGAAQ